MNNGTHEYILYTMLKEGNKKPVSAHKVGKFEKRILQIKTSNLTQYNYY